MLTAFLWIILTASVIALIAIASPIRLSCKAVYRKGGRETEFRAAAHYLHPLILRAEYSSADERTKIFIFGFERRRGGNKGGQGGINTDGVNTDGINTDGVNTDGINMEDGINTDGINTDGINTTEDGINTDGINTEESNTKKDAGAKEKKRPLMSRIKSGINNIKRRRVYKVIRNKPLREKLLRWLKRSSVRAMRTVSFENLKLRVRIGTRDPAALGKIYGYFYATRSALSPQCYHIDLSMEPVFMKRCLDIDSELKIKTTLSTILWHFILIAATFPYLRVRKVVKIKR